MTEPRTRPSYNALKPRLSTLQWCVRAILGVGLLGLLVWSWGGADIDPGALVSNAPRAREYLLGRHMTAADKQAIQTEAARVARLSLIVQSEAAVKANMGWKPGDKPIPGLHTLAAEHAKATRDAMTDEEWNSLVATHARSTERLRRGGFFPPETDPDKLRRYADALLETIAIAIWGTLIAVVLALPVALMGAHKSLGVLFEGNSRWRVAVRKALIFLNRRIFDVGRGFNEFVLALIFVTVIGFGPFAGVLALAIHTFGVLAKVFADAIDTIDRKQVEGVLATGAGGLQIISFGVIPQVLPFMVSQTLLRFESNVRSASVLGLVGAGGIGFLIDDKLKSYQYTEVATMMIMIIVAVSLIDFACTQINRRLA